jgi:hypothetical protein
MADSKYHIFKDDDFEKVVEYTESDEEGTQNDDIS